MLTRKSRGTGAVLAYRGHLLTENRNGLVVSMMTTRAYGSAKRYATLLTAERLPGTHRVTLGADKGLSRPRLHHRTAPHADYPHIAQNDKNRRSAVDERTTRHAGYPVSQKKRKRIEEVFGWMKNIGLLRELRHRGLERVSLDVYLHGCGIQLGAHPQSHAQFSAAAVCLNVPRNCPDHPSSQLRI
jgi:hypothetical protein